jgi:tryptophan 2,3-dioxygenase
MSKHDNKLEQLEQKFRNIGQDTAVHLEGLLWAKPITYWDYIHTDALLSLQIQRTTLPDEMVFIMYHQINELLFKMMLWEINQVAESAELTATFFAEKLNRISRYFDMLSSSFRIMQEGMEVKQYLKFRNTLTPASGFQSAQYRMVEFASTDVLNLIDNRFRAQFTAFNDLEEIYKHLYWQAAGYDHKTGKKTTLIQLFEQRYKQEFFDKITFYRERNLRQKFNSLPDSVKSDAQLIKAMRHYDYTVNVTWVMAHYHAAEKYLESKGTTTEATGGSDWKKYMHPKYQRRIFFPELWSHEELEHWGENAS